MIRIDSIKLKASADTIIEHNNAYRYKPEYSSETGELITEKKLWSNPAFGIKSLSIDTIDNSVVVEASAKVLKNNYFDMININTVEQLVGAINDTSAIKLNADKFINEANVLRCDTTQNLYTDKPLAYYFTNLANLPLQDKYEIEHYKRASNKGIVYKGGQKTFKERFIGYDKLAELLKGKGKKEIIDNLPPAVLKQFQNILRVETNFTQLERIKEHCKTNDTKLISILQSNAIPTLNVFNKITKKVDVDLQLFKPFEGMRYSDIEKLIGRQNICKALGYDMGAIRAYIEMYVKGNISRYLIAYKKLCLELLAEAEVEESDKVILMRPKIITEMQELMKAA
jgi:hypothetical protein